MTVDASRLQVALVGHGAARVTAHEKLVCDRAQRPAVEELRERLRGDG